MKRTFKHPFTPFVIELFVYAVLVVAYFYLVLHFLGDWLVDVYQRDRRIYAVLSLLLITVQGVVLEAVTTALLKFIRSKLE
jgi:hypothetical protein